MSKRCLKGVVKNIIDHRTCAVEVTRTFAHALYKKVIRRKTKYLVDYCNKFNNLKLGNQVFLEESKPISKYKTWIIKKIST